MKKVRFLLLLFLSISSFVLIKPVNINAATPPYCTGDSPGSQYSCSCNQTAYDNCRDFGTDCDSVNCQWTLRPGNQVDCYHTICPVGYMCTGSGPSAYCIPNPGPTDICPSECRGGSACGVGYSAANGCSGNGVGGGCTINQVCCKANYCGGGGGTTDYCIVKTQVTECKQFDNCNGGSQGSKCGTFVRNGRVYDKLECTYNKTTNICTPTPVPTITPPQTPSPSHSPVPIVAQCVSTRIYSPNWTEITPAGFYDLLPNSQVYFCTAGSSTGGAFDKARFTINGVLRPETILKRPTSNDFCDLYTIPLGLYNFVVQGEVHHNSLGWL